MPIVFVYCYGRIALAVRGRLAVNPVSVAVVESEQRNQTAAVQVTSAKQRNVIQTMTIISLAFSICNLPLEVYCWLIVTGYSDQISLYIYLALACNFVCYVNIVSNPLLYAWQYETVRKSFRVLLKKQTRVGGGNEAVHSNSIHNSLRLSNMPSIAIGNVHSPGQN